MRDGRPWSAGVTASGPLDAVPTRWTIAVFAAVGVALVSTVQLYATAVAAGGDPGLLELGARQGLAVLPWLLATPGVVWLARRMPVRPGGATRALGLHGVALIGVAAGVNVLIPVLWGTAGLWPPGAGSFMELAADGFLGLLHVNALVYIVVSGTVQVLDRREEGEGRAPGAVRRIAVPCERGTVIVDVRSIRWIEAAGDYVRLHLPGDSHLIAERMWSLEGKLDPEHFLRVHRSAIVRLGAVTEVRSLPSGDAIAVLNRGEEIRVSRRRRAMLLKRLRGSGGAL